MLNLTGKKAIVTGGACGIGRTISTTLAKFGADVAVGDIDSHHFQTIDEEISSYGRHCLPIEVDVTDRKAVSEMVNQVISSFQRIDILVNNAGVLAAPGWVDRDQHTDEDWEATFAINVKGMANVSERTAEHMKARRYGKIINIASVAGRQATIINPPYAVSKAGVLSLTKTMAVALAEFNINVNAVCPGLLWTPMWEKLADKWRKLDSRFEGLSGREIFNKWVQLRIPLKRPQQPEDIANLVVFLASDAAQNITGQAINVDGGSRTD